jgi:3-methyladenine DNA glycosylase/8-oxoguanine DNA glycosylase
MEPDDSIDTFEYLVRSIIFQQLAGRAAATIHGRVLALYGEAHPRPADLLATTPEHLRSAGVSANKAAALHDLAGHAERGELPTAAQCADLDDDELVKSFTKVRGVGPWTVHMLMMFRLGRPNVLPTGDYGVRKGYQLTYGGDELPTPKELTAAAETWQPWRSVASWYMWRAVDTLTPG